MKQYGVQLSNYYRYKVYPFSATSDAREWSIDHFLIINPTVVLNSRIEDIVEKYFIAVDL